MGDDAKLRKPAEGGSSALVEKVIRYIDRMIGHGELKPGDAVSETTIATTLGVGRVPAREAIRILAGEGVLELVPHHSPRVRSLQPAEILEMMEVLNGFTVMAVHLLAQRPLNPALAETLTRSGARIAELAKTRESGAMELMEEISLFHFHVIKGCGNAYMLALLQKTRIHHYRRYLVALLGRRAFVEVAPGYGRIAAAIIRQDATAAHRTLYKAMENSKAHAKIL